MEKMRALNEDAYKWLEKMPPNTWVRAYFSEFPKCDILLNNNYVVFNIYILEARELLILSMLERRCGHNFCPTLAMLRIERSSGRRAETRSSKRLKAALSLPMPRPMAMNATKLVPTGTNWMVAGKTTIAFALSPCFEGKALPLLHLHL